MSLSIESRCIHLEDDDRAARYGAVSFPIYQTATFAHPALGQSTGYDYSRVQNPTRQQLEKTVAALESGTDAVAFATGMAAILAVMELLAPGDHVVTESDLYGGTPRLFRTVCEPRGITFTSVNFSKGMEEAAQAITPATKALYIETPTNPMMNVTDIRAAAELAHAHGAVLIVDNTFLSPYLQNPLTLGADIVVHSGTKYLSGHNDTLAGFAVVKDPVLAARGKSARPLAQTWRPLIPGWCCGAFRRLPFAWTVPRKTPWPWPTGCKSSPRSAGSFTPACRSTPATS